MKCKIEGDTMSQEEQLKDWYFRYHTVFGKRYSRKQKDRFLDSLVADIRPFREDLELYSFNLFENDKHVYRNLYIGNIKTAKKVICTYYDTPAALLGSYRVFDKEGQKKKTTFSVMLTNIVWLLLGLLFTIYVAVPLFQTYGLFHFQSILVILGYILYFYFFNKIRSGIARRKNLIRNTSSILMLLDKIANKKARASTAYVFLDAGCTNKAGLDRLLEQTNGKVYMLDSIGSEYPLYQVSSSKNMLHQYGGIEPVIKENFRDEKLLYIISGEYENDEFVLPSSELKKGQLDDSNMNTVMNFLDQI